MRFDRRFFLLFKKKIIKKPAAISAPIFYRVVILW